MTYLLGISAYYHDSAAAIIKDGIIIAAAQEERFTRIKQDSEFPINAVNYCLKEAGIDFVILKASEGSGFRDSLFEANYEAAAANGLYVGAYHFFRFDVDGLQQARNFLDATTGKHFDMPLAIDVEEHGNPYVFVKSKVVRQLQDMIDELSANERRVMIYTNKGGYDKFIKENFDDYPLWICSFTLPEDTMEWTIWQYSHWGDIDGIEGEVDLNIFYGNETQWKRWTE